MRFAAREDVAEPETHYGVVQQVSENTGTLYLSDLDDGKEAWAICEYPVEVEQ